MSRPATKKAPRLGREVPSDIGLPPCDVCGRVPASSVNRWFVGSTIGSGRCPPCAAQANRRADRRPEHDRSSSSIRPDHDQLLYDLFEDIHLFADDRAPADPRPHFGTAPGWPQTRAEVEALSDDALVDFMNQCRGEPAAFEYCLACYAHLVGRWREETVQHAVNLAQIDYLSSVVLRLERATRSSDYPAFAARTRLALVAALTEPSSAPFRALQLIAWEVCGHLDAEADQDDQVAEDLGRRLRSGLEALPPPPEESGLVH